MKKIISILICLALSVSFLSVPVSATKTKDGIYLAGTFVPADTQVLCISGRDKTMTSLLADYLPKGCLVAAAEDTYYDSPVFDISQIAKKLPNLKKLYIHQAVLKNEKHIVKMTSLETLSYWHSEYTKDGYIKTLNDKPFAGMESIKELRLYGDYKSYDFLKDMPSLEKVYLEADGSDTKKMKQIFSCPFVTELKLSDVKDFSGIENLTGLKKLEAEVSGNPDLTPLSKLKKLRELDIEIYDSAPDIAPIGELKNLRRLSVETRGGAINLPSLAKLTKLEYLMLNGFSDLSESDWSFLSKMKTVKELTIFYSNGRFADSLSKMTWLKNLSLSDNKNVKLTKFLPKLKNLESFFFMGGYVDISGISELKKLNSVSIWLSRFSDLSELKDCPALKDLFIYNNDSPFDCGWIEGAGITTFSISDGSFKGVKNMKKLGTVTGLKKLSLDFTGIDEKTAREIKKAISGCRIEVTELSGTVKY